MKKIRIQKMSKCSVLVFFLFVACDIGIGAGTLGGVGFLFPTSKERMEKAVDSVFLNYPEYRIPEKWEELDSWSERGFGFLESEIFYFGNEPEEMYYVTYVGDKKMLSDPGNVRIGIRSINKGDVRWISYQNLDQVERERIISRFNKEVVSKIEKYVGVKLIEIK
jgi:hypothetical protein